MSRAGAVLMVLALAAPAAGSRPKVDSAALAAQPQAPALQLQLSPAASRAVLGRAAGLPVDCIDQARPLAVRIVDRTAILWEMSPRRAFLNLVPKGCGSLAPDRILATLTGGSRICRNDLVRVIGSPDGRVRGLCRLGPFIPYTR